MTKTDNELAAKLLTAQQKLNELGIHPTFAEAELVRALNELSQHDAETVAQRIAAGAPEMWKEPAADDTGAKRVQDRIEANRERAQRPNALRPNRGC